MASNKPKKTENKSKSKKQTKTTVETEQTEKTKTKATEKKVEKVEKADKKTNEKVNKEVKKETKNEPLKDEVKAEPGANEEFVAEKGEKMSFLQRLFAKKCCPEENILTIFHGHGIYGALIGEVIGTMLLTLFFLTLGLYQPLYLFIAVLAATMLVWKISGAHLNPIITAGMMASRRISAIRGVLYMLAQILGAWLGYLIISAFWNAGGQLTALPEMAAVEDEMFWVVTLIEFMGAVILGFSFARAWKYRRSTFTASAMIAGGATLAFIVVIIISGNFLGLNSNFALNPAVALMFQILPSGGDNIGALLADIALALATYVVAPMIGGIIGFFLSDSAVILKDEESCEK